MKLKRCVQRSRPSDGASHSVLRGWIPLKCLDFDTGRQASASRLRRCLYWGLPRSFSSLRGMTFVMCLPPVGRKRRDNTRADQTVFIDSRHENNATCVGIRSVCSLPYFAFSMANLPKAVLFFRIHAASSSRIKRACKNTHM